MKYYTSVLLILISLSSFNYASDDTKLAFFESKIRPILIEQCYKCHSIEFEKDKGGLLVDSREALLKGGDSGPSIVPGKPEESLLISAISYKDLDLQMPEKKKLSDQVIADFKKWILDGAVDPRKAEAFIKEERTMDDGRRKHWSFQKLQTKFSHTNIDEFIEAKLIQKKLRPSAMANPEDLLRRVFIDLIGLPPSPEQILRFKENPSETEYIKTVDQLLNSPQFGAKWARFWLDLARYSETAGGGRSYPVPRAWRYRNYVIDSFNKDVPYNRFLKEQIAGDLLKAENDDTKARNLTATAFLALGAKPLDLQNKAQLELDHVDEQLDTIGKVTMGMTIGCARCHDHAFDPITAKDYYRMAAIFQNTKAMIKKNISHYAVYPLPGAKENSIKVAVANINMYRGMGQKISDLERKIQAGQSNLIEKKIDAEEKYAKLLKSDSKLLITLGVNDKETLTNGNIRIRGIADKKGDTVLRGGPLELISHPLPQAVPVDQSGRLQLANWITHPEHPLTSRVYVNRIWAQLFGTGIVSSLDNFGTTGTQPSHPQLLDFLSQEFIKEGWSTKTVLRKILLSETYKRNTVPSEKSHTLDADNELLSYFPKRRLNAEAIRDSILNISGQIESDILEGLIPYTEMQVSNRRSIFLPTLREEGRNNLLSVFDFPDASSSVGKRNVTNLPSQSLFLMNSPFIIERAKLSAEKLISETVEMTQNERLSRASYTVYGRDLTSQEVAVFKEHLASQQNEQKAWTSIFHAMFCSVDFRFLN